MNQFTIRDIENLSGIKAHTLRIWEQRYNLITPKRKSSNHRFYDNEDLKHILRVSFLYHNGVKISKIASLKPEAIDEIIAGKKNGSVSEYLVSRLMEAAIDFNEDKFEEVITTALQQAGLEKVMLNIIFPFLNKIGLLWMTGRLIPAQEHFSSNIIAAKILSAIDALEKPVEAKKVVLLFTPPNEHHEIPLLLLHYLLKKNGNKVVYFGDNVALADIVMYCNEQYITHLHFHLVTNFVENDLDEYVLDLSKQFSEKQIIMSGPAVKAVKVCPQNLRMLYSYDQLINYINE